MKEILLTYTSYNFWANTKLLDVLKSMEPSLLEKELISSFPTIKKTMCHIWGAEDIWLQRLQEVERPAAPGFTFSGQANEAFGSWQQVSSSLAELVSDKDESYLNSSVLYKDLKGNPHNNMRWQMIMHCMNHSSYHRGQIVTMMREVGVTTVPGTDLIGYFRERK